MASANSFLTIALLICSSKIDISEVCYFIASDTQYMIQETQAREVVRKAGPRRPQGTSKQQLKPCLSVVKQHEISVEHSNLERHLIQ